MLDDPHLVRTATNPFDIIQDVLDTNNNILHRSLASNITVRESSDLEMKKKFYHLIITYPQIDVIAKQTAIEKAKVLYNWQSICNKPAEQWYTHQVEKPTLTPNQLLIQTKINEVFGNQTFLIPLELDSLQFPADTKIDIPKITLPGYISNSVELISNDRIKVIFTIPTQIEKYSIDQENNTITISDITLRLEHNFNKYIHTLEDIYFIISKHKLDIFTKSNKLISSWKRKFI